MYKLLNEGLGIDIWRIGLINRLKCSNAVIKAYIYTFLYFILQNDICDRSTTADVTLTLNRRPVFHRSETSHTFFLRCEKHTQQDIKQYHKYPRPLVNMPTVRRIVNYRLAQN